MKFNIFLSILILSTVGITPAAFGQTSREDQSVSVGKQQLQTIKLKVGGINCSADCKGIQNVVSKMNGVNTCVLKGKPGTTTSFEVKYDPSLVTEQDIRKVVEGTPGCSDPDSRPYIVKG